jgi:hypothetical protein
LKKHQAKLSEIDSEAEEVFDSHKALLADFQMQNKSWERAICEAEKEFEREMQQIYQDILQFERDQNMLFQV